MRTLRRLLITILAVALVYAVAPATESSPDGPLSVPPVSLELVARVGENPYRGEVGVASHMFWLGERDAVAEMRPLAEAGVEWIREDFTWDQIERKEGQFDWSRLDNLMAASSKNGINVLGIVDYSARWASSDPSGAGHPHYPPSDFDDYAAYAGAIAARYGENGTFWASRPDLTHRSLKALEIWNEPWGYWFWKSGPDPVAYADMAKRAAQKISDVAPDLEILIPGDLLQVRTDGAVVGWIEKVMAAEPALEQLVDAYSVHPYPHPLVNGPLHKRRDPRWDYQALQVVDDTMKAAGHQKPIWITEVGWTTVENHPDHVSEQIQAEYVRDAILSGLNDYPAVERIFIYTWTRDNGKVGDREGFFGMRHPDGSPKPAWDEVVSLLALTETDPVLTSSILIERGGAVLAPEFQVIDGVIEVELLWQDVPADSVKVYLDGVLLKTLPNGNDGSGAYTLPGAVAVTGRTMFRVCAANDSSSCSADVQIAG